MGFRHLQHERINNDSAFGYTYLRNEYILNPSIGTHKNGEKNSIYILLHIGNLHQNTHTHALIHIMLIDVHRAHEWHYTKHKTKWDYAKISLINIYGIMEFGWVLGRNKCFNKKIYHKLRRYSSEWYSKQTTICLLVSLSAHWFSSRYSIIPT